MSENTLDKMKGKVLIAGGSGLVGTRLSQLLIRANYQVSILSRSERADQGKLKYIKWNPNKQELASAAFEYDYLINLAGAGIADRPWTSSRKKELTDSRIISTNFLLEQFKENSVVLKSYVGASAIGYYGDGGNNWQKENDLPASDSFMTKLCGQWEDAHQEFSDIVENVSIVRIGIVITTKGGAYPKMRLPFKLGAGTYFGSGKQYYSWIHIDDLAQMFMHLLESTDLSGIYNAVTPNPHTNKDFVKAIKSALNLRGLIMPAPSFILKSTMGQMSNVILNSNRVSSKKIEQTGFNFGYPVLESAIKDIEERSI